MAFLKSGGLSILFSSLNYPNESLLTSISSILLSLSSDGEWQMEFLHQMIHYLSKLVVLLESHISEVMDNVSIILQKLSKNHKEILKQNDGLMHVIHSLMKQPIVCIGGGGDVSMLDLDSHFNSLVNSPVSNPSENPSESSEKRRGISEFLSFNLRSLHKNLYSIK